MIFSKVKTKQFVEFKSDDKAADENTILEKISFPLNNRKYRIDVNRPSSYYSLFWFLVEVLFEIPGLAH